MATPTKAPHEGAIGWSPLEPEFWTRPAAEVDASLVELRSQPMQYHEFDIPEELHGIMPDKMGGWVVVKHEHILEVSKNPASYSSAQGITMLDSPPGFDEFFSSMIAMDDPRHARFRKLVSAGFTPRMLASLEDSVQEQAKLIVDEVAEKGEVDFVVDVAARLPLKIVCDLMGIPDSQVDFVFDQTNIVLGASDPEYLPEDVDIFTALLTAGGALAELMKEVGESKQGSTDEDLTAILVNAEVDGEKLTMDEIAAFFILLVVAGNETTRNAISWGLHYLTQNPEQRAIWAADFDGVAPSAVEEIVRLSSPVTYMRRTALADTMLGDTKISQGEKLAMVYLAANRDESVFDDPHTFDVRRNPNPHVGFGGPGPHFCLGAHLARREMTVMFRELFDRLPDIQASGEPDLLNSSFIHGVKHLQASFTPA